MQCAVMLHYYIAFGTQEWPDVNFTISLHLNTIVPISTPTVSEVAFPGPHLASVSGLGMSQYNN